MNKYFKKLAPFVLVILLMIPAVLPMFKEGFFNVHDSTQVQRVFEMGKSLGDGMFPVRWVEDLGYGYGYPIFNYYAPLAYYFAGFLTLIGLNALLATKTMFLVGVLISGLSMFLLGRRLWGTIGGIVSSVLFVYASYHAINIYIRGDVAEFWAYSFIPLIIYSFYQIYKTKELKYMVLGALSYAAVIVSHNLTAFMITPFMVLGSIPVVAYFLRKKDYRGVELFSGVFIIGILISAFYWLPALLELKYTNVASIIGGGSDFRDHYVCLNQLWSSPWGFGGSNPGCIDGISLKIGKIHIVLSVLAVLAAFLLGKKTDKEKRNMVVAFFVGAVASTFLLLEVSKPLWEALKPMEFFQFPWRFLALVALFTSLLGGGLFYFLDKKIGRILAIIVIFLLLLTSFGIFRPQKQIKQHVSYYLTDESLKFETSKTSDEYMPPGFSPKPKSVEELPYVLAQEFEQIPFEKKTGLIKATLDTPSQKVTFNLAYFPSWKVFVNGQEKKVPEASLVSTNLESGKNEIVIKFVQTPVQKLGNLLSVVGIGLALAVIIYERRKQ